MHESIVSPFPIKQEVRLPVEDFGRRTNFSLAWPTHPYIQSHWVRRNPRLVRFSHVFTSRIIRPLSSCAWTPSGYTTYTCFAVTMNQSGKSKGAISCGSVVTAAKLLSLIETQKLILHLHLYKTKGFCCICENQPEQWTVNGLHLSVGVSGHNLADQQLVVFEETC